MGIDPVPFANRPSGKDVEYLIRASLFIPGVGYSGPFRRSGSYLPSYGPFADRNGVGFHGIIDSGTNIVDCLKLAFTLKEVADKSLSWQIFSAISSELERDTESESFGYNNSRRVKRGWVCFTGCESSARKYFSALKLTQSITRIFGNDG